MGGIVYFSSATGNTHRFVMALRHDAVRVPVRKSDALPFRRTPFVLVCPTYADGDGNGAVPKRVIALLNDETTRSNLRGVIAAGNRNFGETFAMAGDIIAAKCSVPVLYRFELAGTAEDVARVNQGLDTFWTDK